MYNARHYDPEIARFVTGDTVIPYENETQSWNRFSYVRNNPIVYSDPTGHEDKDSIGGKQPKAPVGTSGTKAAQSQANQTARPNAQSPAVGSGTSTNQVAELLGKQKDRAVWALTNPLKAFDKFHNWAREEVPTSSKIDPTTGDPIPLRKMRRGYNFLQRDDPATGFEMSKEDEKKMWADIRQGKPSGTTLKHLFLGERGAIMPMLDPFIHGIAVDHDNHVLDKDAAFFTSMLIWCAPKGIIASNYNLAYDSVTTARESIKSLQAKSFQGYFDMVKSAQGPGNKSIGSPF